MQLQVILDEIKDVTKKSGSVGMKFVFDNFLIRAAFDHWLKFSTTSKEIAPTNDSEWPISSSFSKLKDINHIWMRMFIEQMYYNKVKTEYHCNTDD